MPIITLPDQQQRHYAQPVSVGEIAAHISPSLAKAALAGIVNGEAVDTRHQIHTDTSVRIITARDPEALDIIRHSCAHLMAQAVKQLYPAAQITIGPVIENGFYYDYAYARPFTPDDLAAIQTRMEELAKQDIPIQRSEMKRDEAIRYFRNIGEEYKAQIIESIPQDEVLSLYSQGEFTDLCRGPHVPSTGKLKAFKLTKLSGAYWRGDAKNAMLQRIYGTAWADKKALKGYLFQLEEASKRDHRKLAQKQALFHFQEEAPGMVFWHPKGWTIYQLIRQYLREKMNQHGYQEINTPQLLERTLWERSGHWEKFREDMFTVHGENHHYAIKPMNCPGHIQVFNQGVKSYRELPIRLAEFGACHRNEPSGTLHGLMRVRHFTQDDAHIFCSESQIQEEVIHFIEMLFEIYADFGFYNILVKLSTRPSNRVGSDASWDKAEQALKVALDTKKLEWTLQPGEGAFYGPKIEFSLKDCIGRVWQCGTMQVDFSMPERLGACYIAKDGSKHPPVMLHRAIVGSIERFIGILIEHFSGSLPVWLAPEQAIVLPITAKQEEYAKKTLAQLQKKGFRAKIDLRNETIGLKIREHSMQRIPYLLVIGAREEGENTVAIRTRKGKDLGGMSVERFSELLQDRLNYQGKQFLEE